MRITDIIADWLIYTSMMEQASARKDARSTAAALSWQIAHHLVKVLVMNDTRDVPHWKGELDAWLKKLNNLRLKPSRKRLSYDVFFELMYDNHFGDVGDLDDRLHVLDEYNITLTPAQKTELLRHIHLIMVAICNDLSQGKFTCIDDYLNV